MARSTEKHGGKYDYSKSVYIGSLDKLCIICPIHGEFWQQACQHTRGSNCPFCVGPGTSKPLPIEHFITRATAKHGDKFDYSSSLYAGMHVNVNIKCRVHGDFFMTPANHYAGQGCKLCRGNMRGGGTEGFISKATRVHSGKYSYGKSDYSHPKKNLTITCPSHGDFEQSPNHHLNNGRGCPACVHRVSSGEVEIREFLSSLGISFEVQKKMQSGSGFKKDLDLFIPSHDLAIEFNGTYWHSFNPDDKVCYAPKESKDEAHLRYKKRHLGKFDMCASNGVTLYQIKESDWSDKTRRTVWESRLKSRLGIQEKIQARKTKFSAIPVDKAREFLSVNHLQGSPQGARWAFGLEYEGNLVGVIAFSLHEENRINLNRLAFPLGLTVVGGSQKLFKNALEGLPTGFDVVTFSDNQYSDGGIYRTLGFEFETNLKPSYEWYHKGRLLNKRRCRKNDGSIKGLIGEDLYNHEETEHQNMFRAGARCLYDAGYQRWIFKRVHSGPAGDVLG